MLIISESQKVWSFGTYRTICFIFGGPKVSRHGYIFPPLVLQKTIFVRALISSLFSLMLVATSYQAFSQRVRAMSALCKDAARFASRVFFSSSGEQIVDSFPFSLKAQSFSTLLHLTSMALRLSRPLE